MQYADINPLSVDAYLSTFIVLNIVKIIRIKLKIIQPLKKNPFFIYMPYKPKERINRNTKNNIKYTAVLEGV